MCCRLGCWRREHGLVSAETAWHTCRYDSPVINNHAGVDASDPMMLLLLLQSEVPGNMVQVCISGEMFGDKVLEAVRGCLCLSTSLCSHMLMWAARSLSSTQRMVHLPRPPPRTCNTSVTLSACAAYRKGFDHLRQGARRHCHCLCTTH